ncbi:MAG: hypothetical protein IT229_05730 [Flavobacteriales bacterium]|nr:hypothetical protein [Flavobacteriales bacterium]
MRSLFTVLLLAVASAAVAQDATARLRAELERIHDEDQNDRHNASGYIGAQKDSVVAHMILYDSLHLVRVSAILDSAGWLGADVLGPKANQALFLVLQHADARPKVQEDHLPLMREAVEQGHARAHELAMFEDRVAVNNGRPQIYGSQIGWKDGKGFVKPMVDEAHVNERRAAVGLEPLEQYTERFGFTWAPTPKQERVLLLGPVKNQ